MYSTPHNVNAGTRKKIIGKIVDRCLNFAEKQLKLNGMDKWHLATFLIWNFQMPYKEGDVTLT